LYIDCHCLTTLPESIENLSKLKSLCIYYAKIEKLPEWVGSLTELEELELNHTVQYLHVPVDSLIMQGASEELKIKVTSKPWSQWTKYDYVAFQDSIRKKFPPENRDLELEIKGIPCKYSCPIEWEFDAWIRMSESRSLIVKPS